MPLFFLLLVAYLATLGLFVVQNGSPHPVSLGIWTWYWIPDWLPVVLGASAALLLMLLWGAYGRFRHRGHRRSLTRRLNAQEASVSGLRAENDDLRSEIARLRGQLETVLPGNGAVHAEESLPPAERS